MSVSVKIRFEVFKRDRFACTYCGGHPPDVLLEVDHVIPRAAGGSDEMTNLVTACWDCNRGKSDRLLDEAGHPAVGRRTVAALEERLEQARAYMELLGQMSSVSDAMVDRITEAWAKAFEARTVEKEDGVTWWLDGGAGWPNDATLRVFLRELPMDSILNAVDMSASKIGDNPGADRYFYAICWRMIRDKQGARTPVDDARLSGLQDENVRLQAENIRLRDELGEAREIIEDLRINVRRLREQAGRE